MTRFPFIASIVLHLIFVLVATGGMSFSNDRPIDIPPPINIEIVDIAEFNQTKKIKPPTPKKEAPKKDEAKDIKKKKEPKKSVAKPSAPVEPELDPIAVPLPDADKKRIVKKQEIKIKKPKDIPFKKPTLKDTKPIKQIDTDEPFQSVLKNIISEQPFKNAEDDEVQNAEPTQVASLGDRITISEMDALRRQLENCWNVPIGARDADNLVVEVVLTINPNKTVRDAKLVNKARYNQDPFFRAAADSALRAVLSDSCNPLILPDDKYNQWKNITFRFDPSQMF